MDFPIADLITGATMNTKVLTEVYQAIRIATPVISYTYIHETLESDLVCIRMLDKTIEQ